MKQRVPFKAVVFDLGGVLIDFDFNIANRRIAAVTGIAADEVRRRLISCRAFLDFERGRISEKQFHRCVEEVLDCSISYDTFHEVWNCIFSDEIAPTVALVGQLRKQVKVGLLSNTNVLHFEYLKPRVKVLGEMDHIFTSHEIGWRKPEPQAYEHVLDKMKVKAQQAVFIDDLMENVAGARQVGMFAIHATNADAVAAGLRDLGLLP